MHNRTDPQDTTDREISASLFDIEFDLEELNGAIGEAAIQSELSDVSKQKIAATVLLLISLAIQTPDETEFQKLSMGLNDFSTNEDEQQFFDEFGKKVCSDLLVELSGSGFDLEVFQSRMCISFACEDFLVIL